MWAGVLLPLISWLLPFAVYILYGKPVYKALMVGESGFIENLTVIYLLIAIGSGLGLFWATRQWRFEVLRWGLLLLTLGCIYFAGEELSWGQHMFGWATPETLKELNYQEETNLHNLGSVEILPGVSIHLNHWLNAVPRLLLEVGIVVGAIFLPLLLRTRQFPNSFWSWLLPTAVCIPVAVLIVIAPRFFAVLAWGIPSVASYAAIPFGEMKETLFATFLMFYMGSLLVRYQSWKRLNPTSEPH